MAYIIAGITKGPVALVFAVAALLAVMLIFNRISVIQEEKNE